MTPFLLLAACAVSAAQTPKPEEPPEEDESLTTPKEYTFNPLQAAKELQIGNFYFKKRSWRAAGLRFAEAVKWDPNLVQGWLRLGEAREKLKDEKGACEAWAKYLELAPNAKNASAIRKRVNKAN